MTTILLFIIGVLALVIGLLNWLEIHPEKVSGLVKKLIRKYIDFSGSKRFWLAYEIGMLVFLWGSYIYLVPRMQASETASDVLKYTLLIVTSCSVVGYTVSIVYKYFKGYYKG